MSVHKFMHPRNIYRIPPNFKQLAIDYPEFRQFVTQDVSGKVTLDFKNPKALRALTCTLLKKDFQLDVDIPLDKMIPTVPLRINYLLWIDDLLSIAGKKDEVYGIDIGTGASTIYCLLGAKSNGWHMIGTEIDDASIRYAMLNVAKNNLQQLITVKKVKGDTMLKEGILEEKIEQFDFCMCNPPFFANMNDLKSASNTRKPDRPPPKNAFCATPSEAVYSEGGEVAFIKKIIKDSKELKTKIRIYTTMVGHKSSLPELKTALRQCEIKSFKDTEFCQGNTMRWGLSWTYCDDIDLRKIPQNTIAISKQQRAKPSQFKIESTEISYEEFCEKLNNLLKKLKIHVEEVLLTKKKRTFSLTAFENTWSYQRRKRRQKEKLEKVFNSEDSSIKPTFDDKDQCGVQNATNMIESLNFSPPPSNLKRECDKDDENEDLYFNKKTKIETHKEDEKQCFVKGIACIAKRNTEIVLEMNYIEGSAGKDGIHQILQYVKNNWNKKTLQSLLSTDTQ